MADELNPCPFCGGTDIGVSTKFGHAECGQCGATGPWSQHDEAFLAAELRHYWCLRPIEDALRAENARLRLVLRGIASGTRAYGQKLTRTQMMAVAQEEAERHE